MTTTPRLAACGFAICLGLAGAEPLDTILVLEMSEGTEHATGLIRPGALAEDDRAGVVGFLRTAQVFQPLTNDRDKIAAGLRRAGFRAGGAIVQGGRIGTASSVTAGLAAALYKACGELGEHDATGRQRAIVVVFGSDDPSLATQRDALKSALSTSGARLYAIAVQRSDPNAPPLSPRTGVNYPFPTMTVKLLEELAEQSGGRVFQRNWDLKKILNEARRP